MKIKIKQLGPIKQAEFILGDLTLICGGNNTGKTYATYALFGFLDVWREMLKIGIEDRSITTLLNDGIVHIDLEPYVDKTQTILQEGCKKYTQSLSRVFSSPGDYFKDTEFQAITDRINLHETPAFEQTIQTMNTELFSFSKTENSTKLMVSLIIDKEKVHLPAALINQIVAQTVNEIIFGQFFPKPFIVSAERTGAAIFRKELNFARNRLLKEMSQTDKNIDPIQLLSRVYNDYALPVERNVDFTCLR